MMKKNKREAPYLNNVIKKYFKEAKKYYPNFRFSSSFSMYNGGEPTSCELELGFDAKCINGTEYEVKQKSNLIHYTSHVQNVIDILNSGFLRLSNLISVNDPQEINFIIKNLNLNLKNFESYIEDYKSTFFSASFCKVVNNEQPDEFPMWRLYGNDGFGCAIVFEIENFGKDWLNFIISQVQYGDSQSVERFKNFINFHNSFQESYNFPIQNIPKTLTSFLALHKNKIWEYENEIRLLTHQSYDEYSLKTESDHICGLKHSISKDNKKYSYIELPLHGGKEYQRINDLGHIDTLNRLLPVLKVKEIILGYRIDSNSYFNILNVVNYISKAYGYHIGVKESHLKQYMI